MSTAGPKSHDLKRWCFDIHPTPVSTSALLLGTIGSARHFDTGFRDRVIGGPFGAALATHGALPWVSHPAAALEARERLRT